MDPSIFTSIINSYLPEPHASLLNGIIFGIDLKTTKTFFQQLKAVGLLHIVVLSGMNITILIAAVGSTTHYLKKYHSILITIVTIIIFILFVGPKPPVIRAGISGIITLVAIVYGKKADALYILMISALLIFLIWPEWVKTVSFQLSYGATLGIILWGSYIEKKEVTLYDRIKNILMKEIKPTLAAQTLSAPLIFLYFRQVSLIAPISNILVAVVIPPLMIFGFLTAFLGKIHYLLGLPFSYICYGMLSYIIYVVELLSRIPFSYISIH